MKIPAFLFVFLLVAAPAYAKHDHKEKWYQDRWCAEQKGQTEIVLPDGTRADCLTSENSVELDFGNKWAEAIGQALFYGLQTGKQPGIVLILEDKKDRKFWIRLNTTIEHFNLPIRTWAIGKGAY